MQLQVPAAAAAGRGHWPPPLDGLVAPRSISDHFAEAIKAYRRAGRRLEAKIEAQRGRPIVTKTRGPTETNLHIALWP